MLRISEIVVLKVIYGIFTAEGFDPVATLTCALLLQSNDGIRKSSVCGTAPEGTACTRSHATQLDMTAMRYSIVYKYCACEKTYMQTGGQRFAIDRHACRLERLQCVQL